MKKVVVWRSYRHDLETVILQADIYSVDTRTGLWMVFQGGAVRDVKRSVSKEEFQRIIAGMSADVVTLMPGK